MTERERDDAVVAGEVQVQLALWAPESTVADQRARCRPFATFAGVERVMQLDEALEAVFKHLLVGSVTRVGPIHERHVSGLADEETQADDTQVVAFALGVAATRQLAWRSRRDVRVEVRRVERQHVGG